MRQFYILQDHYHRRPTPSGCDRACSASPWVRLAGAEEEFDYLDELIRSTPDTRESRVEKLRNAIATGTYNVGVEQIAEKIIGGSLIDEIF